jgi:hypothetical protein
VRSAAAKSKESKGGRKEFWKTDARAVVVDGAGAARDDLRPPPPRAQAADKPAALAPAYLAAELRVELAPNIFLSIAMSDDVAMSRADVAAIRAAAAPLLSELAKRRLTLHAEQGDDV